MNNCFWKVDEYGKLRRIYSYFRKENDGISSLIKRIELYTLDKDKNFFPLVYFENGKRNEYFFWLENKKESTKNDNSNWCVTFNDDIPIDKRIQIKEEVEFNKELLRDLKDEFSVDIDNIVFENIRNNRRGIKRLYFQ